MARIIELEVGCCGDCPYYRQPQDKCKKGATEGSRADQFFTDCPLRWREV